MHRESLIPLLALLSGCLLVGSQVEARPSGRQSSPTDTDYWIKRRAEFRRNTTFELSADNIRLFGGKFSSVHSAHLPFWFDYQLFKTVYNKSYASPAEELARHHEYVKTCVRTLKQRVLYRVLAATQDAAITSEADLFYDERLPQANNGTEAIMFAIEFDAQGPMQESSPHLGESPLDKALRLVRAELGQTENRNQLNHYLMEFHEVDGSAIAGSLPY